MDFVKMLDDELEEFLKELICDRKTTEEGTRKAMWLDALREECENEIANRMETGIWGTARLKTGQYINIYTDRSSRNYDVFIILNEANDAPTDTEVDIIEKCRSEQENADGNQHIDQRFVAMFQDTT